MLDDEKDVTIQIMKKLLNLSPSDFTQLSYHGKSVMSQVKLKPTQNQQKLIKCDP